MNINYLSQYIAEAIHSSVRCYSIDLKPICAAFASSEFYDPLISSPEILETCLSLATRELPAIFCVNNTLIYGSVRNKDTLFLAGPIRLEGEVVLKHSFSFEQISGSLEQTAPIIHFKAFLSHVLHIHNLFADDTWSVDSFWETIFKVETFTQDIKMSFVKDVFEMRETTRIHNPYAQEVREQNSIRNGDVENLRKSWQESFEGEYGKVAESRLRQYKNLAIIVTTLASRSAIEGGVLYEAAYSLADNYCRKIEKTDNPTAAGQLGRHAELQFAAMVKEIRERKISSQGYHSKCSQCKNYIFSHLHEPLTVLDIAEELNLHPNYLSTLFRETEGISLSAYIREEKIKEVKGLLSYTNKPLAEIASHLGFSSQSHLGSVFKKETGMTMKQYRAIYSVK